MFSIRADIWLISVTVLQAFLTWGVPKGVWNIKAQVKSQESKIKSQKARNMSNISRNWVGRGGNACFYTFLTQVNYEPTD